MTTCFRAVLVDYDEDLFAPPSWVADEFRGSGIEWEIGQNRTQDSVLEAACGADVVMVQSVRPLLGREVIEQLDRCRCIVRLGIGYDSVDVESATEQGILVCNVPGYCVDDVADHALALLMDSVRHVARQDRWIRSGRWDRTGARPARRFKGRTMGLVGFGRIAQALAERVAGFGMSIIAYDPFVDCETMESWDVDKVGLEELLSSADFVSIQCPLTEETHHLLDEKAFSLMKEGVFLVNTSRGPIISERALTDALRAGRVWGAGLDVFEEEPLPANSPLREFGNVTFTPHVGANSQESVADLYLGGCQIAVDVYEGRWPESMVNPAVVETTESALRRA